MTEVMTRPHRENLVRWAREKPEVVVLSGDLTKNTEVDAFAEAYPDRFFSMGMAEQNMLSFAGGLAREGYVPLVHTFAVFLYRRPLDQLQMSIAYPNLPVRLFGFLPGLTTPGGVTHQAIDDLGVLRVVPNLSILVTADATEVETVLEVTEEIDGPVYIRMQRGEVPRLFSADEPMRLGQGRVLSEGNDIVLVTCGVATEEALRATALLSEQGISIEHIHVSTLKPFNGSLVVEAAARAKYGVITMENHSVINGLGSAVAEALAEAGAAVPLHRIGVRDRYGHGASKNYLFRSYEMDALALVHEVERIVGQQLGIKPEALIDVRIEPRHSAARAEGM